MKVMVTGGAGFIGSHIAEALLKAGHEVVIVDNLTTGKRAYVPDGATLYEADIRDTALGDIFAQEQPEVVCHHAAQMSVSISQKDPLLDASVNIVGSLNVLQSAIKAGTRRFVFASSGGTIYGNPTDIPVRDGSPTAPISPYGVSKLSFEHYLRISTMPHVVLRYANVYGPRQSNQSEAGVIAIFAEQMLNGQPTTIFGDGEQVRDFIFVDDVVAANVRVIERNLTGTFNIGTGTGTSINTLHRHMAEIIGYREAPQYSPAKPGEVYKIVLNRTRATTTFGWSPKVSLEDGLARTIDFYR